jgi:hypothetical protein
MEFETITKPEGTQNAKVNQKNQWLEEMKKKMKED